jgi:hypothetical protein
MKTSVDTSSRKTRKPMGGQKNANIRRDKSLGLSVGSLAVETKLQILKVLETGAATYCNYIRYLRLIK